MSTEVSIRSDPSAFYRPSSLFLPDVASSCNTPSLLKSSSYSPFPVFPGANVDPHGLDQFLLPPDDPSWLYTHPDPAAPSDRPIQNPRSGSGLKKVRSFTALHRPSPLSQPPVSVVVSQAVERRQRKRSSSMSSTSTRITTEENQDVHEEALTLDTAAPQNTGKKGFSRALFTRRSVLGNTRAALDTPPLDTSSADSVDLVPPPVIPAAFDDVGPSTPMSSRSSSNNCEVSSASSTSSSEGVKTPVEIIVPHTDVEIAGGNLASALAAAKEKGSKKSIWRGWLGGRRASTNKVYGSTGSGTATPSDVSAESSPNASTVSLVASIPQLTLTPSPSIISPPRMSLEERAAHRGVTIEALRRLSVTKLGHLRAPSPHPLALALKRQYSNLPDEVACSIQSGEKVFPLSVNGRDKSSGMNPMQGGLNISLAVKNILDKLERGECPMQTLSSRRLSDPMIVRRPRGVLDFINRPTFEERNIVLYPNGTFSPISMARPGYGVWDLDFSPYLIALSTVDGRVQTPWPRPPRASIGAPMDGFDAAVMASVETQSSPQSDDNEEILISPHMLPDLSLVEEPRVEDQEEDEPISSFRNARKVPQTWDYSSEEEEESDEEDEKPLAALTHKKSAPSLESARPAFVAAHSRAHSSPVQKTVKVVNEEEKQRKHMDEVARARERRLANVSGEAERKADAEKYQRRAQSSQAHQSKRASITPVSPQGAKSTQCFTAGTLDQPRRRVKSSYDTLAPPPARPDTLRHKSADGTASSSRRYHSFYEIPSMKTVPTHQPYPIHVPALAPMYTHPAMAAFPMMVPQQSMIFPSYPSMGMIAPTLAPQHTRQQSQSPLYLQMQGRSARSSLSVPTQGRSPHKPRLS